MATKPDSPCTDCGKLMWRGRGSRPKGAGTCLACRRARPGYKQPVTAELKTCPMCPTLFIGNARDVYCSPECRQRRWGNRPKPGRGTRYGAEHQRLRRQLLPTAYGQPCSLCGTQMTKNDDLHLDHTPDGLGYRGFSHARCNILDGAQRGGQATRTAKLARAGKTNNLAKISPRTL